MFLAALSNPEVFKTPDATAGSEFIVRREFENRTSLIVDPADGTIPSLTEEAKRRQVAIAVARQRPTQPADLPNTLRCITLGVPKIVAGSHMRATTASCRLQARASP